MIVEVAVFHHPDFVAVETLDSATTQLHKLYVKKWITASHFGGYGIVGSELYPGLGEIPGVSDHPVGAVFAERRVHARPHRERHVGAERVAEDSADEHRYEDSEHDDKVLSKKRGYRAIVMAKTGAYAALIGPLVHENRIVHTDLL